jgi:nucleotide-binding universal stress UspA family protein
VWPYPGVEGEPAVEAAAGAAVETARVATEESGLPDAEAVGAVGDPADAIMTVAEDRAADVIVVGSRGRGWLDRLVRPSVSQDVLRRTDIPVLLVKWETVDS